MFWKESAMKAIISQIDMLGGALWEGEALSVTWDNIAGEFVILGDRDTRAISGVVLSMIENYQLTVELEDTTPGRLVWRGHVGSARFQPLDPEKVECCLTLSLDDWFGIVPRVNGFAR
jgi:hypothetical protein